MEKDTNDQTQTDAIQNNDKQFINNSSENNNDY